MQHLLVTARIDDNSLREDLREFVVEHLGTHDAILVADGTGDLEKDHTPSGCNANTGTADRLAASAPLLSARHCRGGRGSRCRSATFGFSENPDTVCSIPGGLQFFRPYAPQIRRMTRIVRRNRAATSHDSCTLNELRENVFVEIAMLPHDESNSTERMRRRSYSMLCIKDETMASYDRARRVLMAAGIAVVLTGSSVALAPAANAGDGCFVQAASDNRAYAQCSHTTKQYRAGAACILWGLPAGTAYGQWVRNNQVSVADCSYPRRILWEPTRKFVIFYEKR
ncbi:hypothetical protein [Nocardia barduliensis]|uniref:hypothetical protein n=1 Tax=Nocardia barduliensis TaxID=2736643 RepID=UPI001574E153|nr:hypothetical protein [Nocardia barduliensis]